MSNLTELAKRLRLMAGWHEMAGFAERQADLLAAAEVVERSEWRPISDLPSGVALGLVGGWFSREFSTQKEWRTDKYWMSDRAISSGYTHYFVLPAPPEVKP